MADEQAQAALPGDSVAAGSNSQEIAQTSPSSGESSSSSASAAPTKHCAHCNASEAEKALKPCSKCQTALYCSRDCQKGNFKVHKKTCAKDAQIYALKADLKPSAPPRAPKEGHRGGLQKWQFDT